MISKTIALLEGLAPGTYVPPGKACFDDGELVQLAALLKKLVYSPSELRKRLQELGVNVSPANFYSEIPMIADVEQIHRETAGKTPYGTIFDPAILSTWLGELMRFSAEFDPPVDAPQDSPQYRWKCMFSYSDAMAYHCFIRKLKPGKIVEVGSGFSTLIARAACETNHCGEVVCIEPYPKAFLKGLAGVTVHEKPVQMLRPEFFNDTLADGDILFIDSTHTVKHGSDVLHLYLTILPNIRRNIVVHVHDIHLPRVMPLHYLRDIQIYWTEQYLLYAYLLENARDRVIFGSAYHFIYNKPQLEAFMHGRHAAGGASLWFEHKAS